MGRKLTKPSSTSTASAIKSVTITVRRTSGPNTDQTIKDPDVLRAALWQLLDEIPI